MFKHLTDFGYKRSGKEALGFYIAWFVVTAVTAGVVSGLVGMLFLHPQTFADGFQNGLKVGAYVAIIAVLVLAFLIARDKGKLKNISWLLLILASVILAFLGGGLLGLIIPAYLTTKDGPMSPPVPLQ